MDERAQIILKLNKFKYLRWINGTAGLNFGYLLGLLVLNVILFRILCTLNWKDISKEINSNFLEVEDSIKKNILKIKQVNNMIIRN